MKNYKSDTIRTYKCKSVKMAAKTDLLQRISDRFEELYRAYGEPPVEVFDEFPQLALESNIENDLSVYGVHFTSFEEGSSRYKRLYETNLRAVIRVMHMFIYETADETHESTSALSTCRKNLVDLQLTEDELKFAALCSCWNSKSGFGNSSFRFLYGQFTDKDTSPKFTIAGESVEFSYNPFHKIDLELLLTLPEVWNSLKKVYDTSNPMVSWDSQKARFFHKSFSKNATHPTLTNRHRDVYLKSDGTELDRKQAMLILERPVPQTTPISLGYVLFSNDGVIRSLLEKYFGKPEGSRFSSIEDEQLNPIFDRWWRSLKTGLVVWDQSTIHYEGIPEDMLTEKHIRRLVTGLNGNPLPEATETKGKLHQQHLPEFSFRAVIGTHTPQGLTRDDLINLASLSQQGWCPEIYTKNRPHNKGSTVDKNVVNHKTTQFVVPRKLKEMEKAHPSISQNAVDSLPKMYKEFYGIYDHRLEPISAQNEISVFSLEEHIRELSQRDRIPYDRIIEKTLKRLNSKRQRHN